MIKRYEIGPVRKSRKTNMWTTHIRIVGLDGTSQKHGENITAKTRDDVLKIANAKRDNLNLKAKKNDGIAPRKKRISSTNAMTLGQLLLAYRDNFEFKTKNWSSVNHPYNSIKTYAPKYLEMDLSVFNADLLDDLLETVRTMRDSSDAKPRAHFKPEVNALSGAIGWYRKTKRKGETYRNFHISEGTRREFDGSKRKKNKASNQAKIIDENEMIKGFNTMFENAPRSVFNLFVTQFILGERIGVVRGLEQKNLDFDELFLRITGQLLSGSSITKKQNSTKTIREIDPKNPPRVGIGAVQVLAFFIDAYEHAKQLDSRWLFPMGREGRPVRYEYANNQFKQCFPWGQGANTTHSIRASSATNLSAEIRDDMERAIAENIAVQLGHTNISTQGYYLNDGYIKARSKNAARLAKYLFEIIEYSPSKDAMERAQKMIQS